jgi:hypothetical protein
MWMEADTSNWPSLFEHSRPETVMCIYGPPLFFFDSEMADMGVEFFLRGVVFLDIIELMVRIFAVSWGFHLRGDELS